VFEAKIHSRSASMLRGELIDAASYPHLANDWTHLEAHADGSPFNSWAWVSTWLEHLPKSLRPLVFSARVERQVVALAILIEAPEKGVRKLFGTRSFHLQETDDCELDEITIEYAGLLVLDEWKEAAYRSLLSLLQEQAKAWRCFRISASADAAAVVASLPPRMHAYCIRELPSYGIHLASLQQSGKDYVSSLNSRTRRGIRQTLRAYEALGRLVTEVACDAEQALEWLAEMEVLHQAHWQSKGKSGSFGSAFFGTFHRALIKRHTHSGLTQIMRIKAGDRVVGYLYNLQWRKTIFFYNSGLNYGLLERNDRPGFLAQCLSIEAHLAAGIEHYDFLAGDQPYKSALGLEKRVLHWISIRPAGWRLSCEQAAYSLLRRTFPSPLAATLQAPSIDAID
jgi:CelD/BcsL family acetyltransferase involved in cellulose biosynthesis